jgi:branched-chain amino acid transport system permease protein
VFDISLPKEKWISRGNFRAFLKLCFWIAAAAGLAIIPNYVNDYVLFVINTIVVYCLVSVGFNIVVGYLGQLAFANAAFFGIGAYVTGLLMVHLDMPFALALGAAAVSGGLAGALVTLPALRLSGYYLVTVTWAFTELMRWVYVHGGSITFGSSGFNVPQASIFGIVLSTEERKYYAFLVVVVIGILATARLVASRFGRAFVAIRNNEMAAAMMGISVTRTKLIAFAWSGFVVGAAGGLYAILNGRVTPESFGLEQTLLHFVIVMAGGLGSIFGSIAGAVLLTSVPEFLRNLPGLEEIALSLVLIFVLFVMPRGIGGFIAKIAPAMRETLYRGRSGA